MLQGEERRQKNRFFLDYHKTSRKKWIASSEKCVDAPLFNEEGHTKRYVEDIVNFLYFLAFDSQARNTNKRRKLVIATKKLYGILGFSYIASCSYLLQKNLVRTKTK